MAQLPKIPTGKELEDYVAALYQSSGHYVEKSIIDDGGPEQVLELDVVATDYNTGVPKSTIVEVKSGGWGFPDIFKVRGWMDYLGIEDGALFTTTRPPKKDLEFVGRKAKSLGVRFLCCPDTELDEVSKAFEGAGYPSISDAISFNIWRWSCWIERRLMEVLRREQKDNPTNLGSQEALRYHRLINNGIFFEEDVRDRAAALYDAYRDHPKLSAALAAELAGHGYDPENPMNAADILNPAVRDGKYPVIQASLYLEHRARLALIKTAVDYVSMRDSGKLPVRSVKLMGYDIGDLWFSVLPQTFRDGVDALRKQPTFLRYPYFWQVFLWAWGGFILTDRRDLEFAELSRQTGVPVEEIPTALSVYDTLFAGPTWMASLEPHSKIEMVKLVPVPFRGVGAFQRMHRYGVAKYEELGYSDWTGRNMAKWHNSAAALLETKV